MKLKDMAYISTNRVIEKENMLIAKKLELQNYFLDIQRQRDNKTDEFLERLDNNLKPKNLKIIFLHNHSNELLMEDLQAQSIAEFKKNVRDP